MFKIFLAVGHRDLENFLKGNKSAIEKKLHENVKFVGETVYREGILQGVADYRPDVILIREGLQGNANLTEIIYKLKVNFSDTRIIFIAGDREVGDALLATLVQLGIYDLIIGSKVNAIDMLKRIVSPNSFSDVAHFMPKVTVDEKTNAKLFDAPDLTPITTTTPEPVNESVVKPVKAVKLPQDNGNTSPNVSKSSNTINMEKKEDTSDDLLVIDETQDEDKIDIVDEVPIEQPPKKKPIKTIPLKKQKVEEVAVVKEEPIPIEEPIEPTSQIKVNIAKNNDGELNIITDKKPLKVNSIKKTPSKVQIEQEENNSGGLFGKLFGKKETTKRLTQQVVTFVGGKGGVGNSQIAFNTALKLAQDGYKTIYIDLNDIHSSIDCIFQLGYADVGVDSAIKGIQEEDYFLIERSIVNMAKILPDTVKENYLYKTYSKIPLNMDFMFFSQRYMERVDEIEEVDYSLLKDLNMYLLMQQGYDVIIIDAPYNIFNKFTETALIYSNKVFFTITQDYSVIGNHLNQIKLMDKKRIKFREKFYYLLNKYENADLSINDVYKLLMESIRLEGFNVVSIPNMNKEFINANYLGTPILWYSKNKDMNKAFSEIETLIMR